MVSLQEVVSPKSTELKLFGSVHAKSRPSVTLGSAWVQSQNLQKHTAKRMSLLVFFAVVPCLRNAGVTGSSPVGGTSTSTSLTAVYLSRGRKPWCVSLLDYLGGNTIKSNNLAALIGANNGPAGATADATTQAAVWEAIYDDAPYNTGGGNFSLSDVHNDASLIADATRF